MSDNGPNTIAELYGGSTGMFSVVGNMASGHANNTATLLPDGTVLAAGSSWGYLHVAPSADLFDPGSGTFSAAPDMVVPRSGHTATLLPNGAVLLAGGDTGDYSYQATSSAEIYYPNVLVPAPVIYSLPGSSSDQGAILHGGTSRPVTASDPARVGEALEIYGSGLTAGGAIAPQVSIGGRVAKILFYGDAPNYPGLSQVNVLTPDGVASSSSVPVRWVYLGRPSNTVTIGVQ